MISCRFGGQLGNVMLEIYGVFHYAMTHHIDFSDVVFNRHYDVQNQDIVKIMHANYIEENIRIFSNIKSHFIDESEYNKIPFLFCEQKHILHGDDIDPNDHQHICFRKFDFHFPKTEDERTLFCKLFNVKDLKEDVSKKYSSSYDIEKSCAVHVRRTDFKVFKNGKHLESIDQILDKITSFIKESNANNFVVFSDDIEWCEQNIILPNVNMSFHKNNSKDYEDLILMSLMKKGILSGISSFSYCAKLLNSNIELKSIQIPAY